MKKSELTQKRIVDAAEVLFQKLPIDKVPVSKIAQEAKVAKGTVYLYFETKEDIVWAVLEKYFEAFSHVFNKLDLSFVCFESVDTVIDTLLDFIIEHKKEMYVFHQASFFGYIGKEKVLGKYEPIWIKPMTLWISQGVELGRFKVNHIPFTVNFINASFHGIIDDFILGSAEYTSDIIRFELKQIIRKLLG